MAYAATWIPTVSGTLSGVRRRDSGFSRDLGCLGSAGRNKENASAPPVGCAAPWFGNVSRTVRAFFAARSFTTAVGLGLRNASEHGARREAGGATLRQCLRRWANVWGMRRLGSDGNSCQARVCGTRRVVVCDAKAAGALLALLSPDVQGAPRCFWLCVTRVCGSGRRRADNDYQCQDELGRVGACIAGAH